MNTPRASIDHRPGQDPGQRHPRLQDDRPAEVCLALSGGNALGAYAAGAVEAIENAGMRLDMVCGASIGALTGAIVAGNPPGQVLPALRRFWAMGSSGAVPGWPWAGTGRPRELVNAAHALQTLLFGRPGLFSPHLMPGLPGAPGSAGWSGFSAWWPWDGLRRPVALFDPRPTMQTLQTLVDFDWMHAHGPRFVVCAVDVETGQAVYFDSRRERIGPQHLLASTGFLPSFPPVQIDGRWLADPGPICNLPLDPVLQHPAGGDRLCLAVDLFSSSGTRPQSLDWSLQRAQDLTFGAQTDRTLQAFRREQGLRHQLHAAGHAGVSGGGGPGQVDVVLAAYHPPQHEIGAKTLEYSAASLAERWQCGLQDMAAGLAARARGDAAVRDLGFALYLGDATPAPADAADQAGVAAPAARAAGRAPVA